MNYKFKLILLILYLIFGVCTENLKCQDNYEQNVVIGAERFKLYAETISGKKIALAVNHTSVIRNTHLLDTLLSLGLNVSKIFTPEHGFAGTIDAGEEINEQHHEVNKIPVVSLYGKKNKPSIEDMVDVDVVLFDMQDVGVRFFTYLSTLHYIMEACAESNVPLIVLDRPNPNGFYIDGPVLEPKHKSFVGLHPVPIVYGMTIGEYAKMINGEGWLTDSLECNLIIIPCENYNRDSTYSLSVIPSPNLQSTRAILLYPSVALFEGTVMSVGRGTAIAFEIFGHPEYPDTTFSFVPRRRVGAANPKFLNQRCYGENLTSDNYNPLSDKELNLEYLIDAYKKMGKHDDFFLLYFYNLTGTKELKNAILQSKTIEDIRESWQPQLNKFKEVRKKYLIYEDFQIYIE